MLTKTLQLKIKTTMMRMMLVMKRFKELNLAREILSSW